MLMLIMITPSIDMRDVVAHLAHVDATAAAAAAQICHERQRGRLADRARSIRLSRSAAFTFAAIAGDSCRRVHSEPFWQPVRALLKCLQMRLPLPLSFSLPLIFPFSVSAAAVCALGLAFAFASAFALASAMILVTWL